MDLFKYIEENEFNFKVAPTGAQSLTQTKLSPRSSTDTTVSPWETIFSPFLPKTFAWHLSSKGLCIPRPIGIDPLWRPVVLLLLMQRFPKTPTQNNEKANQPFNSGLDYFKRSTLIFLNFTQKLNFEIIELVEDQRRIRQGFEGDLCMDPLCQKLAFNHTVLALAKKYVFSAFLPLQLSEIGPFAIATKEACDLRTMIHHFPQSIPTPQNPKPKTPPCRL